MQRGATVFPSVMHADRYRREVVIDALQSGEGRGAAKRKEGVIEGDGVEGGRGGERKSRSRLL